MFLFFKNRRVNKLEAKNYFEKASDKKLRPGKRQLDLFMRFKRVAARFVRAVFFVCATRFSGVGVDAAAVF